eukprot:Awhi_evm1s8023
MERISLNSIIEYHGTILEKYALAEGYSVDLQSMLNYHDLPPYDTGLHSLNSGGAGTHENQRNGSNNNGTERDE